MSALLQDDHWPFHGTHGFCPGCIAFGRGSAVLAAAGRVIPETRAWDVPMPNLTGNRAGNPIP